MAGVTTCTLKTRGDKIFHTINALDSSTTMEWQAASEGSHTTTLRWSGLNDPESMQGCVSTKM